MRLNRRDFMVSALALIPTVRVLSSAHKEPSFLLSSDNGPFTALRRGAGTFVGRGGTIGWLVTENSFIIIDSQFPESAEQCLKGLQERTERDIDLLINTHHHFDHTAGNGVFQPHAKKILAHKNVPDLQRKAAEQRNSLDSQVYASATFENIWREDIGEETIRLQYYGPAHTSGDAVIHFEKADVVHMGDLVFNRMPPYIDRPAGASIQNWISVLEQAHSDLSDETIFIFGHSHPDHKITGTRADLFVMRDYLTGLLDYTRKGIAAGKSADTLAQVEFIPGFPDHITPDLKNIQTNAINTAYQELTEEKNQEG